MSIYKGTQLISGATTLVGESRNVGQIIQSTIPLTDAGLHLLDGALIDGNGIYSAFVDYIASIYDASASYFTTEASWQDSVTNYGVCGKFVYDSVNNTVRLPKYSNKIFTQNITQSTAPVVGNGMALGLTNGTNNGAPASNGDGNQLFRNNYGQAIGSATGSNVAGSGAIGVTTDPTKSGLIAQLSNITTSLDGYYYIVVATSTKTDIQVDIDEVATDLNGKADVDLSNTNNQAKILMSGMGMPGNKSINLTLGATDSTYTAPANGYFVIIAQLTTNDGFVAMFANLVYNYAFNPYSGAWFGTFIPIKKGETMKIQYWGINPSIFSFVYAVGSESEAN